MNDRFLCLSYFSMIKYRSFLTNNDPSTLISGARYHLWSSWNQRHKWHRRLVAVADSITKTYDAFTYRRIVMLTQLYGTVNSMRQDTVWSKYVNINKALLGQTMFYVVFSKCRWVWFRLCTTSISTFHGESIPLDDTNQALHYISSKTVLLVQCVRWHRYLSTGLYTLGLVSYVNYKISIYIYAHATLCHVYEVMIKLLCNEPGSIGWR